MGQYEPQVKNVFKLIEQNKLNLKNRSENKRKKKQIKK